MPNQTDTKIRFQLSSEQVKAVAAMVEDQLFRVKFIDPKLPGHKSNLEQASCCRIRSRCDQGVFANRTPAAF